MRLLDARKLAIRRQVRIRFPLANGVECVITELGIAKVPGLDAPAELNLEEEFARAASFTLEPAATDGRGKPGATTLTRARLESMAAEKAAAAEHAEE